MVLRFQDFPYSRCEKLVYFDPDTEKFELLPTPKVKEGGFNIIGALGVIQGFLSMALFVSNDIEILAMKEYGVAESWVTLYTISQHKLCVRNNSYFIKCPRRENSRVTFYSQKNNVLICGIGFTGKYL
ncbi:unnamed protein product [Cuscuta epithymum]|uniref:F-box associated domain-containing protein n=1 Tax=Cuscuta epithymum TaxID=186058 RepID=A0AAV0FF45_9ASTE|nr:unnamed protein product [Cuscuta epithymum]